MDLIALAEDLGLKETKQYKYRISEIDSYNSHCIERYDKVNGILCSVTISNTMLYTIIENSSYKQEYITALHNAFNSAEARMSIK